MILNAVMCVWNEEDIIESTIKHAFAQGCSNVFIVDNDSTDETVNIAISAGAILADSFKSDFFNEFEKIAYLNTVVKNYNEVSNEDYIWWLYIDADEFPNIDCTLRIIDVLKLLDPSVRAIHGYMFDHIPTHAPYNISGYHPADFMQVAKKSDTCKIPLLRYDKNKPHLYSTGGAHSFDTCGESIPVALDILDIHHFNFRKKDDTLRRLKLLTMQNATGTGRLDWLDRREKRRKKLLDAKSMYHHRYESAKLIYDENKYKIFMTDALAYSYRNLIRWYDQNESKAMPNCSNYDKLLSAAMHYFFLGNFDLSLCRFNDILEMTGDNKMKMLITIKMASCLASTSKDEALVLLRPLLKCNDSDIRDYAEKQFSVINEYNVLSSGQHKRNDVVKFNITHYSANFEHQYFV